MAIEHKTTYCRICESVCGMVATVEDGRLVALRPDKDHPLSAGFACQKGIAFTEVVNDPDRVTTPLRRLPGGGFEEVGWDEAMTDIAARLGEIHRRHGSGAVGWYVGNPGAFSYNHIPAVILFIMGLGRRAHLYTASSQDSHPRVMASQLLYGYPLSVPFPDLSRTEWDIIDDLMRRMSGRTTTFRVLAGLRSVAALAGRRLSLRPMVDGIIRFGPGGDRGGLRRRGLSFDSLTAQHPHGKVLSEYPATGVLKNVVSYRGRRIRLKHNEIEAEVAALGQRVSPVGYPLRLIGMREPRSENSWMHNSPLLMRGARGPRALMHIEDAGLRGIAEGDEVSVRSPFGKIALPATLTEDIVAGTVAIPHGWGHRGGGWRLANAAGGVNVNELTSDDPQDVEALSGMAWLSGVPIEVERT